MATKDEYDAVAVALLKMVTADINTDVPVMFRSMIPPDMAPHISNAAAKLAIDTLDAYRAKKGPHA